MAIHICHSSFLQGHFTASRHWKGRARSQGDGWQREGQPDSSSELMAGWSRQWRTGGRNKSLIFLYQGAWSIDGPESLSSKSRGFMGSARGSGSLDDRKTHVISYPAFPLFYLFPQTSESCHTNSTVPPTQFNTHAYYGNIINLLWNVISFNQATP